LEDAHPNADGSLPKQAAVLPVGIVYPEKSKYRSVVIVRYECEKKKKLVW
jgi:hypothetical protein